jgi:hypothetical protein
MSTNVASQYGWYQIEGAGPVATTSVSADDRLYLTATAGTLDNSVVASDLVTGIVARSATSSGFATCQIDHPSINALGGSSGANSGDVTLAAIGAVPNANGASLSGQVLTLQPADGSFGGLVTTGAQTIAGAKTFSSTPIFSSGTLTLSATTTNLITSATSAATASATVGAFTFKPTATLDANDLVIDVQSAAAAHLFTVDLEGDITTPGAIAATGAITGSNVSGTNTGNVTAAAYGSTPNANGLTLTAQALNLEPASATHPGGITAATYTALVGIEKITLTAEAENGGANTIEVEGQVSNILGTAVAATREVYIKSLAVTDGQGDLAIGAGANPGTLIKAHNPATGANLAWITTTAAGHFRVLVTNTAVETNVLEVSSPGAITAVLKLTFA